MQFSPQIIIFYNFSSNKVCKPICSHSYKPSNHNWTSVNARDHLIPSYIFNPVNYSLFCLSPLSFHHPPPCHKHFLTPAVPQPSCLCPSAAGSTNGLLEGKTQKPSSGFIKFQILQFEILRHIKLHSGYICFQTHHKNQPNPSQREFDEIERKWKVTHNRSHPNNLITSDQKITKREMETERNHRKRDRKRENWG